MDSRRTSAVDLHVGRRVRTARIARRVSQQALGQAVGVTFQQIQKYEKGTNRVGSGRLYQIAALLEVPVTAFFEGGETQSTVRNSSPYDLLADPVSLRMVQAFAEIPDVKTRRAVLALVESMNSSSR